MKNKNKNMTIEELFGTLQQAVTASWRKHLRTAKYAKHEALDEFYKEMPEKVDNLIEAWMGANGKKVKGYTNLLTSSNMNTLKYLTELKKICKDGYDLMDDNEELESLLDDIVNLINSTLYKVKELSESTVIDLVDYIKEALICESKDCAKISLDNWAHISSGMSLDEMEGDEIKELKKSLKDFYNKNIKDKFDKLCKDSGLDITTKFVSDEVVFDGVDVDNVQEFFRHFYDVVSSKYELYIDDILTLFAECNIPEETVNDLAEKYDIE